MNHPGFSPPAATPTQRNRRLLLALPACALPILSACGGGGDLSYDTEQSLYMVGDAITPNNPKLSGGNPRAPAGATATFSVRPALPAGLTMNTSTGVISGTPTKLKRQASHTVTATSRDVRGSAETQLRITVTGRGAWSPAAKVPGARSHSTISPLPKNKFLVAGGQLIGGLSNSVEIYDASTATWSTAPPMLQSRAAHSAVVLGNGHVLLVGGDLNISESGYGNPESRVTEIYDPFFNAWKVTTGKTNKLRTAASAHLLPSGMVLVVGGLDNNAAADTYHNTVELYDPATGLWTLLPTPMSAPRAYHAAALLPDGKTLLVAGGHGVTTAELYKVDGTATKVIPYGVAGEQQQAVKLDDGSVLVTSDGSNLSWRFNPVASSWTTSAMVNGPRGAPTLTVLADGRVLAAGGVDANGNLNSAEIYNPDVNRWTAAAPMAAGRLFAGASLSGDASVLVVSGFSGNGLVDASERYIP